MLLFLVKKYIMYEEKIKDGRVLLMANSMIEDMFAETNQYNDYKELKKNKNKNGRGKKVILFFVLLIILVALGIAVFLFIKSTQKTSVSVKNEFISYLEQGNFIDMNMSAIEEVFEKLANNSSTLKSNITISTNVTELEELANYTAEINTDYDAKKHRGLIDINLDYLNNAIFDMQALITGEKIALKSDDNSKDNNILFTFEGSIKETDTVTKKIEEALGLTGITVSQDVATKTITVAVPSAIESTVTAKLTKTFADNDIKNIGSNTVSGTIAGNFFLKCLVAVFLSPVL